MSAIVSNTDWLSNSTRYNSEDLELLCRFVRIECALQRWTHELYNNKLTLIPIPVDAYIAFRDGKTNEARDGSTIVCDRRGKSGRGAPGRILTNGIISLLQPKAVQQRTPLESLLGDDKLPKFAVQDLAQEIAFFAVERYKEVRGKVPAVIHQMAEQKRLPSVRIEKRVSVEKKKLTREESLAYLREQYKPRRGKQGDRVAMPYMVHKIGNDMAIDYQKEFDRLEKWRKKFEAKGGVIPPNQRLYTFSEFLRFMAGEIEAGKC